MLDLANGWNELEAPTSRGQLAPIKSNDSRPNWYQSCRYASPVETAISAGLDVSEGDAAGVELG
jgi:hypothetical protein